MDLFSREQQVFYDVLKHLNELPDASPINRELFELLVKEYGIILKHLQKIVSISDKTSEILINGQKFKQEKINELEKELLQNQIAIMLSQIQPHFLYNSLVVIRQLCKTDPKMAEETVVEFSNYLRGNLDSLTISEPIPFERELQHVETYLAIEKKRFGDKLNIVYDTETKDFSLPTLTLQSIVENAVRYGATKKEYGGTVTIKTETIGSNAVITVTDDGMGFEPEQPIEEGRSHVGIKNVQGRLAAMCGGMLEIKSKPGEGTTVLITIPKKGTTS